MRIAHIVCTFPPYYGGMGNVVFQTANAQGALGHEVIVLTPDYYEPKEIREAETEPAKTHAPKLEKQISEVRKLTPDISYGNAARLPTIAEELDEMDLVHFHYPFFGTANLVRKWKLKNPGKPLVITYHMDNRSPDWKGLIFKLYARYYLPKMLNAADCIITSSFDYIENSDARDHFLKHKDKWRELPFGVDTERFGIFGYPTEFLERHNLKADVPIILFVGGMDVAHYFKGVSVLLDALHLVKKSGVKFQTLLVGDGELKQEYMDKAKYLGLDSEVRFAGKVSDDDLPYYYNMAELLVLPSTSRGEAFGMVLLEAMASAVPIIASDLPGVRTVARDGGTVVPPGKSLPLAEEIIKFFAPGVNRSLLGARARFAVENKYSWSSIVKELDEIYTNINPKL